jgi:uncharacterized membrane protein
MKRLPIYLYLILLFLTALWFAGIVTAPLLKQTDHSDSADLLYSFFSRVCHQNEASSFHIEGEKFGVCIRCTAVYAGFLAGLLIYPVLGGMKRRNVPHPLLLSAAVMPMVLDVVLNLSGFHASSSASRIITGGLFGLVVPWWVLPVYLEAFSEIISKRKKPITNGADQYARETK